MRGYGFSESAGTGYGKKTFVLIDAFSHLCDKISLVCKNILIPECSQIGKGIAVSRIKNNVHKLTSAHHSQFILTRLIILICDMRLNLTKADVKTMLSDL